MAGIIPCFLHEWNEARQITLIGTGISDYLEPAIKPERADEIVALIRSHLDSTSDWDVCRWQDLSFNTPLKRLASEMTGDSQCTAIPLDGSFEAYWNARAGSLRQNVRRDRAKAEARGKIQFDVTTEASAELLDTLIEMHRARWQRQGQPGMIDANGSAEFLRDVAREFAARDLLRIFSIRFDEKLAAVIFGFSYRKRMSNYMTAFDPEHERFGFGRTLLYEALRYSFQNGYNTWDFLRGDEPYKHWWGAQEIPKARVIVTRTA
jgi:CelD/BcsL family acetyltransferase involved in cellulose biosynthesis